MIVWVLAFVLGSAVCIHSVDPGHSLRATPAYGYAAVSSALNTGRSIHYYISLSKCTQMSGPPTPELTAPFGGRVDYFRTFTGEYANTHFMDTRLMMNSTGRWVHVSRRVEIHPNNTARVYSYVFTPDFFFLTYEYSHTCSLTSSTVMGAIQFYEGGALTQITSFTDLMQHITTGGFLHFDVSVASCTVTPPSPTPSTSMLGAHIREFDVVTTGATVRIDAAIQPTVGYTRMGDEYQLHLHNIAIYSDNRVIIRRTNASPPDLIPRAVETYSCRMATTTGGGVRFYTSM